MSLDHQGVFRPLNHRGPSKGFYAILLIVETFYLHCRILVFMRLLGSLVREVVVMRISCKCCHGTARIQTVKHKPPPHTLTGGGRK